MQIADRKIRSGEKNMTFGERLYKLRNGKNIFQEELAELLDYMMRGTGEEGHLTKK